MDAHARNTDPTTSHAAARSVRRSTSEIVRALVAKLLREHGPMTDEQIAEAYDRLPGGSSVSPSGLRTRRAELVRLGVVVDSGNRGTTESGRAAVVWTLTA